MPTVRLDALVDGQKVKIVINQNDKGLQYFAHNKSGANLVTPHIYDYSGNFSIHQDSPDGKQCRPMDIKYLASGTLASGLNYFSNSGLNVVILPTQGLIIDTSTSGLVVQAGNDAQPYLMAIGTFWGVAGQETQGIHITG